MSDERGRWWVDWDTASMEHRLKWRRFYCLPGCPGCEIERLQARAERAKKRLRDVVRAATDWEILGSSYVAVVRAVGDIVTQADYVRCEQCDGDGHVLYRQFDGSECGVEACDDCDCVNGWRPSDE